MTFEQPNVGHLDEEIVKTGEKKSAVILPFPIKPDVNPEREKKQNYDGYKTLGGSLDKKQYEEVLRLAEEGVDISPTDKSMEQANFMAKFSGITLSPETVNIYRVLRHQMPDRGGNRDPQTGDQQLLAEALRLVGDTPSLAVFMNKHPHIFK